MQIIFNSLCNGALIALIAMAFVVVYCQMKMFTSNHADICAFVTYSKIKTAQLALIALAWWFAHESLTS